MLRKRILILFIGICMYVIPAITFYVLHLFAEMDIWFIGGWSLSISAMIYLEIGKGHDD